MDFVDTYTATVEMSLRHLQMSASPLEPRDWRFLSDLRQFQDMPTGRPCGFDVKIPIDYFTCSPTQRIRKRLQVLKQLVKFSIGGGQIEFTLGQFPGIATGGANGFWQRGNLANGRR